ncbi:MAG: hypothetical protein KC613_04390 [Myxococcales bacterium]|nr:hypothetical protein [Myxococcales bacterium]MCB9522043.1 hypothetical protein [Myxococcales bacterium]
MYGFEQEEKRYECWKCGHAVDMSVKAQRTDECPSCGEDLHVCKNCRFWDPGAENECRENNTYFIRDREKANFCMAFEFKPADEDQAREANDARAKLEAMFAKLKK